VRRGRARVRARRGRARKSLRFKQYYFPDNAIVKLKYYDEMNFVLNASNGYTQTIGYRGNGPYDPDVTTGTGQRSAFGWNQWMGIYGKCYVYAAKITLVLQNNSKTEAAGENASVLRGYTHCARTYGADMTQKMIGQPDVRGYMIGSVGAGNAKATIKWFKRTQQMFSVPTNKEDWYCTNSTDNPTNQWYFIIRMETPDAGTAVTPDGACFGQIWIKYYCHFFDRKINLATTASTQEGTTIIPEQVHEDADNTFIEPIPDRDITGDGELLP